MNDQPGFIVGRVGENNEGLIAAAEHVSPLKDGCPNEPSCGHVGYFHDVEDDNDPLPMCGVYDDTSSCQCGRPPAGYARVPGQRVWSTGDRVPADVPVLTPAGDVAVRAEEWTNTGFDWLVEVEALTA